MMPIRAEIPRMCKPIVEYRSWTEDIPVCTESGIGSSTNQIYREDGQKQEEHPFEDQSFHFKCNESTYVYGIFDGHEGVQTAKFTRENVAAELLLDQLNEKSTDEDVKQVLKQAFIVAERSYIESIGDKLAEKTSLQLEIPSDLTPYEAYQKYPLLVDKLSCLNSELSCGTTAAVALIHNGHLYVANVGNSRVLLCRTGDDKVLRVLQLSVDHDLSNDDEQLRISLLGIPTSTLSSVTKLGNQNNTRCIGNYLVKGGYKDYEEMAAATSEPVIAEPDITGGIALDESHRFLMIMSAGLYRSLEEATGTSNVNKELAKLVVDQFRTQSTLTGVAQAVVDKIVRIHHDTYMSLSGTERTALSRRDDITLILRNFNYPLPNAMSPNPRPKVEFSQPLVTDVISPDDAPKTSNSKNTESEDPDDPTDVSPSEENPSPGPSNNRIKPYVDFSEYYVNVEKARRTGTLPTGIDF